MPRESTLSRVAPVKSVVAYRGCRNTLDTTCCPWNRLASMSASLRSVSPSGIGYVLKMSSQQMCSGGWSGQIWREFRCVIHCQKTKRFAGSCYILALVWLEQPTKICGRFGAGGKQESHSENRSWRPPVSDMCWNYRRFCWFPIRHGELRCRARLLGGAAEKLQAEFVSPDANSTASSKTSDGCGSIRLSKR